MPTSSSLSAGSIFVADLQTLLSVGQIASKLGRPRQSIHRKIVQLNIQPALTLTPGGARYNPAVVEIIGAALRRPNYNCRSSLSIS